MLNRLLANGAMTPRYRADVTSEDDFEARQTALPLCTVWGESEAPDGIHFTLSVSLLQVEDALLEELSASDPAFRNQRDRLHAEIKSTVLGSLTDTARATGAKPSEVCVLLS